jgi:uncharacterized protein YerC
VTNIERGLDYRDPDILDKLGLSLDEQARVAEYLMQGFKLVPRGRNGNVAVQIDLIQLLAYFAGTQSEGEQMLYRKDRSGPLTASNIALADDRAHALMAHSPKASSGYKGVQFNPNGETWVAHFRNDRLGYYDTAELAARARDCAVCVADVPGAYLNFPAEHKDCADGCHVEPPIPNSLETSPEIIDRMIELRKAGRTQQEVADAVGVSTVTVQKYLNPLGLGQTAKLDDPALRSHVLALRRAGKTYREITEETGVDNASLSRFLSEQGLGRQTGGKSGSGYTGVYRGNGGKSENWRYQITRGGKVVSFKDGFATPEAAHEARQARIKELDAGPAEAD